MTAHRFERRRRCRVVMRPALALAVLLCLPVTTGPVMARFADGATATAGFTADVLDAPTNLGVTSSLGWVANLTWSPVADTYAAGYKVYRSTTSGSGYVLVATVTPRTATATGQATGGPGRYYFVVRAFAGNWLSQPSNEVTILLVV